MFSICMYAQGATYRIWLSAPFSRMLWGPMIGQLLALKEGLGKEDLLVQRLTTTEIVVIFEPDKSFVNAGRGSIGIVGASRGDGGLGH